MKALILASILFFSLRAMSAELGENQKSECPYSSQTSQRIAKEDVSVSSTEEIKNLGSSISK
jgi:hypothetical protein